MKFISSKQFRLMSACAVRDTFCKCTKSLLQRTKLKPNGTVGLWYAHTKLWKNVKTARKFKTSPGAVFTNHSLERSLSCSPDCSISRSI